MKTDDNYFRGFPTLWNAVAFYLFVLKLPPWLAAAIVVALAVVTFVPFKFLHPMRVARLRSAQYRGAGAVVGARADRGASRSRSRTMGRGGLVVIALYLVGVGLTEKR